jgi:hypothetical protein
VTQGAADKRAAQKCKLDLADAVAMMEESLSKRTEHLEERGEGQLAGKIAAVESRMSAVLANREQTLRMLQASIDSSREVNGAILAFLQSMASSARNAENEQQTSTP